MALRVYISGPITGREDTAASRFGRAQKALEAVGYETYNPVDHAPEGTSFEDAMRIDIPALLQCDGICFLHNSQRSRGALLERDIAEAVGMLYGGLGDWIEAEAYVLSFTGEPTEYMKEMVS